MRDKFCPSCGRRLSQFLDTGMLGCPDCYDSFREEIIITLKDIQGKVFHTGKSPKISGVDKELVNEYKRLLSAKENACIDGRFSDMAEISNQLSELIGELKKRGLI